MKILRMILLIVLIVIVAAAVAGFAVFWDTTRGPLPQVSGSIDVPGLDAQVEVLRDDLGIANVYASTLHDLYFGQGYVQAQDRWWQMEFNRHIGSGAIEELTGQNDDLIGNDLFIRTAGWRRAAERDYAAMDDETLTVVESFAEGVNAYLNSHSPDDLALEYRILGLTGVAITITPWTPVDSIVWGKVLAWNLTGDFGDEIDRAQLLEVLGPEMVEDYQPAWPYGERPTVLSEDDLPLGEASLTTYAPGSSTRAPGSALVGGIRAEDDRSLLSAFGLASGGAQEGIGSNNWVVTGSMSQSGMPLLANDPHLGVGMPSIWYQIGLHCQPVTEACPIEVSGFALPASPGVIIGHNASIAWGVTNAGADVLDLYRIEVNPDNPLQYRWEDGWRDMIVHDESVRFGDGGEPVNIQVRETHFGPIINDHQRAEDGTLGGFNNDDPLAMHWLGNDTGTLLKAVRLLNAAQDWTQFRDALSYWDVPSQNFVYADGEGNIGYQMPGNIPVRAADHDGLVPADGTTGANEWRGFIPYDSMPRIFNPARDYVVTANQAIVPLSYYDTLRETVGEDTNPLLSYFWSYGQRAERINQMIEESGPHDFDTFQAMQSDNVSIDAIAILPYLDGVALDDDARLADYRAYLTAWDKRLDADRGEAALWGYFSSHLLEDTFDDQLPGDMFAAMSRLHPLRLLLDDATNIWWDDAGTPDAVETRDDILRRALAEAADSAEAKMGADRAQWAWGQVHTVTFENNPLGLSGIGPLEALVNRGPIPVSGGYETVNAASYDFGVDDFPMRSGSSMRMIVDLTDLDQTMTVITTGQSGHPFSPHFDTEIELWRTIRYHPLLWSRAQIDAATKNRLMLAPAAGN